jgi:amino acid adenylation domain-containing protein
MPRRQNQGGLVPLSPAQRRLWFLDQAFPGSVAYNNFLAVRLRGPLDIEAVHRSLTQISARHEVLRTRFPAEDGMPRQEIDRPVPVRLRTVDVSDVPPMEREARAGAAVHTEQLRPYDLAHGPLVRYLLVRLGPADHVLAVLMHHMVFDHSSSRIYLQEFGRCYEAFRCGGAPDLAPVSLQYADYARWHQAWVETDEAKEQLDFWVSEFRDLPASLELAADHPRRSPGAPSASIGALHEFVLGADLTRRIVALGYARGATPFMTLLAAFGLLVSRYGRERQDAVVIGFPMDGRSDTRLQQMIGLCINTLAVRVECRDTVSFHEVLAGVRDRLIEAYGNLDLPFERVVEEIAPARDLSRNPLFQVMFQLRNVGEDRQPIEGLDVELFPPAPQPAKFDLTLDALLDDGRLRCAIEYSPDLFEQSTVERMAKNFGVLLTSLVDRPETALGDLAPMPDDELRQVLWGWNATEVPVPRATLSRLFEDQVTRTPEAVALIHEGSMCTYRELDNRANRLARLLISHGMGPGAVVALVLPRSADFVVALWAVLKTGAAYLPVDPGYPAPRVAFLLKDSRAALVITHEDLADRVPEQPDTAACVVLDAAQTVTNLQALRGDAPDDHDRVVTHTDADLAYVLYTSGSTGRPKPVGVPHNATVNQVSWLQGEFGLDGDDRVLQKSPTVFDTSIEEIVWPLTVGASVVVAVEGGHRDPAYLAETIRDQGVTMAEFVPVMLREFLREPAAAQCTSLRLVTVGGEAMPGDLAAEFHRHFDVPLVNLYGPTETAIQVSRYWIAADAGPGGVPIGRPVWNTRFYVLDARMRPVPWGAVGELYVAGAQLGWGYPGHAAVTAERFVPDPFGGDGGRLYRTGDLVRWRADEELEFLGRADDQLKVRGFRVEPGEIETELLGCPGVVAAAVTVRPDQYGNGVLVGYVVPQAASLTGDDLRERLRESLPSHMVPSRLVMLNALPLTVSGKLDRRGLPDPGTDDGAGGAGRLPSSDLEKAICAAWTEVLGCEVVDVDADFFGIGGHSLLVPRLAARIRKEWDMTFPLRTLFENPTIATLAVALSGAGKTPAGREGRTA